MGFTQTQMEALMASKVFVKADKPAGKIQGTAGKIQGTAGKQPTARQTARKCSHGVERASCRMCGGKRMCVHLLQRKFCALCGGTQVCEHGRVRFACIECGGNRVCKTCRACKTPRRDTDCLQCQGAKEWAVWMEGRGAQAI